MFCLFQLVKLPLKLHKYLRSNWKSFSNTELAFQSDVFQNVNVLLFQVVVFHLKSSKASLVTVFLTVPLHNAQRFIRGSGTQLNGKIWTATETCSSSVNSVSFEALDFLVHFEVSRKKSFGTNVRLKYIFNRRQSEHFSLKHRKIYMGHLLCG